MYLNISYFLSENFVDYYKIVLNAGDDSMYVSSDIKDHKINFDIKISHKETSYYEGKELPISYLAVYDFYLFLVKELESIKNVLSEKYSREYTESLISRADSFIQEFDFDDFYMDNFESLMMRLNKSSLKKLNEIINILEEEYNDFKKMTPDIDVYIDMIAWIEDALYLLKKFAEKLAINQRETITERKFYDFEYNDKSPLNKGSYAA